MKNMLVRFILILIIFSASDCSKIFHDTHNPCTAGSGSNAMECETWKKKYPKEYERYKKRISKEAKGN